MFFRETKIAWRSPSLLVTPSLLIFLALFLVPFLYFFVTSFWSVRNYSLQTDFTLAQYFRVFVEYTGPLIETLLLALVIAVVTTAIAFGYAFFCRFWAGRYGPAFMFIALVTLFGGYLTKIYVWKIILGTGGLLNSGLLWLGIVDEPVTAFLFSPLAVVVTLAHYTLPFAILPIYGALRTVDDNSVSAAEDLGATRWRVLYDIILPQIRIGLLAAFSLTFLFSAGDYVAPALVGGPKLSMVGLFIESQFGHRLNPPLGAALSFVVIASCMAIMILITALLLWLTRQPK